MLSRTLIMQDWTWLKGKSKYDSNIEDAWDTLVTNSTLKWEHWIKGKITELELKCSPISLWTEVNDEEYIV